MSKKTKYLLGIIFSVVAGIVYLFLPVDVVADAVPVAGWIDDIAAILLAIGNAIRLVAKIKRLGKKD